MKDSGERLQKGKEGFLIPSAVWSWAGLLPGSGKHFSLGAGTLPPEAAGIAVPQLLRPATQRRFHCCSE